MTLKSYSESKKNGRRKKNTSAYVGGKKKGLLHLKMQEEKGKNKKKQKQCMSKHPLKLLLSCSSPKKMLQQFNKAWQIDIGDSLWYYSMIIGKSKL